jgi:adenylyltransferase/sulfurtransferase
MPKVESARARILEVNPHVEVSVYQEKLTAANAMRVLEPYDVIVDGSDNFPTRYLVNDACVLLGKPLVYGAILKFEGQASVFNYKGGPNYRDLLPQAPPTGQTFSAGVCNLRMWTCWPAQMADTDLRVIRAGAVPSCAEGGVLGVLCGVIGGIQATEAIKIITGIGEPLSGRIVMYDALNMRMREARLAKNPDLAPITALPQPQPQPDTTQTQAPAGTEPCAVEQARRGPGGVVDISVEEALRRLQRGWAPFVLDVRLPQEADIVRLPFTDRLCPHREVDGIAAELPQDQDILVYCKMGGRSAQACEALEAAGVQNLYNLEGGITAWAKKVDQSMPVY